MPLTLLPGDFIHPDGKLQTNMFPKESLTDLLAAWLEEAEAKVAAVATANQDAAAAHWVYYRAYETIADRIGSSPSRTQFGGNSGGGVESTVDWGQNKAEYWQTKAAKALKDFEYYVQLVPPPDKGWTFQVF